MALDNNADQAFRWEDLDPRILSHKTSEVAEEMHRRAADARRRIAYETAQRGNSAGYWPELLAFHEKLADEWAERCYAAHCETWVLQGRTVSPAFIRAVRDRAIAQMIAARKSSILWEMSLHHMRTGQSENPAVAASWNMRMSRLAARWNRKLEAEAAAAEYSAASRAGSGSVSEMQLNVSGPTWESFYQEFKGLSDEELRADPGNRSDRWLRGYVDYQEQGTNCGDWHLGGGISESFKARFVVVAMNAGRSLRATKQHVNLLHIWLHHVFQDLVTNNSDLLFSPSGTGGIVTRVCEASALYCLRQQAKTLQEGRTGNDGAVGKALKKTGPLPLRPVEFVQFAGRLWMDSKGAHTKVDSEKLLRMASKLDEGKFLPPTKYLEKTYAQGLKSFNSKNANSKVGPITTWGRLVQIGDKDQVRGMRRMLSRCAAKLKRPGLL